MAFSILNAEQRGGVGPNGKPSLTIDESAVRLTREGLSWSAGLGQSAVVTYAFRAAPPAQMPEGTGGFERLTSQQIQKVEEALDLWSAVANITFVRVGDGTFGEQAYSNNAAILFGYYNTGPEGVSAFAFFPGSQSPSSSAGDVWVNGSFLDNYYPTNQNDEGFATLVHEIGHAIGLSHPSDYDAGNGALTYAQNADHYEDSELYSIMSYFPPTAIGGSIPAGMAAPAGPQLDDIAAVQRLYGANTQTKLGDTVYGYIYGIAGERPEQTLRTSGDGGVWGTIWDAGGNDTLDFRSSPAGQKLDLQAGHFSDVHGNIGSLAIAQGVVVENAVGGVYDDLIIGNDVANVLSGLEGADTLQGGGGDDRLLGGPGGDRLDGGGGFDTADYSDAIGAVSIRLGVTGAQGADADSLVSIEALIGSAYGDVLDGDAGSNRLSGGDGDDVLDGGSGFDRLEGGQGNDIFFIDSASDTAVEVVGQGFDQLYTSVSYSLAAGSSVDYLSTSLQVGTAAIDLTGNELNNQIFGNNGSNVLNGAAGVDFMRGFGGDDVYFVDSTSDSTIEAVGGGFDQVYTSVSLALSAGTSIDYLSTTLQVGTGAINLTGNELDNQIFGNDGANVLRGEGGVDFMRGFGGNDIYFVDNTSDSTIEAAGGGFDEVYTSVSLALSAGTWDPLESTCRHASLSIL